MFYLRKISIMKKLYALVALLIAVLAVNAQSLSPSVIASGGAYVSNSNGSLSYTVGEMTMVETFSANGNILTQGFQQPNESVVGLIGITRDEFGSLVVYPNPAVDDMWFGLELPENGKISISLYNDIGQKISDVYNSNYTGGKVVQQLNVSVFAAGVYFLTMNFTSEKDGKVHTTTKKFQVIN